LPGGRIDEGEDAAAAARRELREEVGIEAQSLIHLGQSHVDPGLMPTTAEYFLCDKFDDNPAGKIEDAKELFEGEWVELSTVGDRIASNEIKNPFVIVGYTLASSYLAKHRQ
jgi:ADP-ribose pyrophosphatase